MGNIPGQCTQKHGIRNISEDRMDATEILERDPLPELTRETYHIRVDTHAVIKGDILGQWRPIWGIRETFQVSVDSLEEIGGHPKKM